MWNITWRKESKLWPDSPAVLSPPLKVVIPGKIWTKVKIPDESESEGESPIVRVKVKVKVTPESLWGWMKEKWISNLSKIGSCSHFLPHLFTVKNWSKMVFKRKNLIALNLKVRVLARLKLLHLLHLHLLKMNLSKITITITITMMWSIPGHLPRDLGFLSET